MRQRYVELAALQLSLGCFFLKLSQLCMQGLNKFGNDGAQIVFSYLELVFFRYHFQ